MSESCLKNIWLLPPKQLLFNKDGVHIWRIDFESAKPFVSGLREILSSDERERADRFRFQKDHDRFVISHAAIRNILGQYLNMEPRDICFEVDSKGKPRLSDELNQTKLYFNMSHSHLKALVAISKDHEMGVDIEYLRPEVAELDIAKRFFASGEVSQLLNFPKEKQIEAFYACWTRKEAFIKAKGDGLSISLDSFEVSLDPGERVSLKGTNGKHDKFKDWSIRGLIPGFGYAGALAVRGDKMNIQYWDWQTGGKK